ncbi:hypothetical protein [Streptomyces agglomeratus]|uniref:hypothetical protein n=1 Tax=Streptomyces agglomeratus TaxID=285458 RepID=UPI000854DEBB|nr:hypothetical protein [Streptomyces agglomeratus]OEJ49478.1 hypothetical protein BGK72_00210 [Streptomyces agglomeratus]
MLFTAIGDWTGDHLFVGAPGDWAHAPAVRESVVTRRLGELRVERIDAPCQLRMIICQTLLDPSECALIVLR